VFCDPEAHGGKRVCSGERYRLKVSCRSMAEMISVAESGLHHPDVAHAIANADPGRRPPPQERVRHGRRSAGKAVFTPYLTPSGCSGQSSPTGTAGRRLLARCITWHPEAGAGDVKLSGNGW